MKLPIATCVGLVLLALAGCSSGSSQPPGSSSGSALPPPDPTVAPAEGEVGAAPAPAAGEATVVEPSVAVESSSPEPAPGASGVISIPEARGWTNPEIPLSQQQTDIDACFRYASAQIARDTQIDYDRQQVRAIDDQVVGMAALNDRVDHFTAKRRRGSLFDACMRAKGYTKT